MLLKGLSPRRSMPPKGLSPLKKCRRDLTRRTQFIRKSFRDEYLDDLVESDELAMSLGKTGAVIYRLGT